ncbi:substrate-binding domain-containing protein [Telmatospirillum siberiense]|uniref:Phosphate ABC transporter substrate-binding protein n=1 Tax=Telmatospirillum siberiense TaxID=382514 RepID=A0A2N3PWS6_9PROT|nr:substrate-binding domain-containing protein [Telmatospirillum siberiense]PKU24838.1 phosphate ABC transporter substrate-binding protein [Telmatospirillum siberiense]
MKIGLFVFANAVFAAVQLFAAADALADEQIRIVGSSTVYPFATAVAEYFGKTTGGKAPVVESIGTGGGLKLFCASLDAASPDIAAASRRIRPSETANCAEHGVKDIAEITIGFDGLVIVNARPNKPMHLTRQQLFQAIAKSVPQNGKWVANPYRRWRDIDAALPDEKILIFGPAPNHGTRDSLVDLAMTQACAEFPALKGIEERQQRTICAAVREDGAFVDVSQNYSIALQRLIMEPHAVGILPFSYFDQNTDKIQAASFDGQEATYDNIFSGRYSLSRPLFLYVKTAHLQTTRGLREYIAAFTSEKAWSRDGYLAERGLIALADDQRGQEAAKVAELLKTAH